MAKQPRLLKSHAKVVGDSVALGGVLMAFSLQKAPVRDVLLQARVVLDADQAVLISVSTARRAEIVETTARTFAETVMVRAALDAQVPRPSTNLAKGALHMGEGDGGSAKGCVFLALTEPGSEQTLIAFMFRQEHDPQLLRDVSSQLVLHWPADRSVGAMKSVSRTALEGVPSILSDANPFGLTGSEMRVCHLLRSGQRPDGIATGLEVSISTVRTHLRHIYAKTERNGLLDLMHLLTQQPSPS